MADNNYIRVEDIVSSLANDVLLDVQTDGQKEALMSIAVNYAANVVNEVEASLDTVVGGRNLKAKVSKFDGGNWEILKISQREFEKNVRDAYEGLFSHTLPKPVPVPTPEHSPGDTISREQIPFEFSETEGDMEKSLCDRCYEVVLTGSLLDDEGERDKVKGIAKQLFHEGVPDIDYSEALDVVHITAKNKVEKEERVNFFIDKVAAEYGSNKTTSKFKVGEHALPIPDKYKGKELVYSNNPQSLVDFVNDVFVSPDGDILIVDILNFVTDNNLRKVRTPDRYVNADEVYAAVISTDKWKDRRKATDEVSAHTGEFEEQKLKAYELFKKYIENPNEGQIILDFMGWLKKSYKRFVQPTEKDKVTPRKSSDFAMRRHVANEEYHNLVDSEIDPIMVYQQFMARQDKEIGILRDENIAFSTTEQRNQELVKKHDRLSQENHDLTELVAKYENEKLYNHQQLQEAKAQAATAKGVNKTLVRELRRVERNAHKRKVMGGKYMRTPFKIAAAAAILFAVGKWGVSYAIDQYVQNSKEHTAYEQSINNFNNKAEALNERMERALKIMRGEVPIPPAAPVPAPAPAPAPASTPRMGPSARPGASVTASNPLYRGRNPRVAYRSPRK